MKLVNRFNEISDKFAEPMDDDEMNEAARGARRSCRTQIDAVGGWELERKLDDRDGRAALPPWDAERADAVGRRAPPRRAVPAAAVAARHAAARRADEPPRRRVRRVARALPQGLSRAPSSRSRTIATSSTTSPAGSSSSTAATAFRGRATTRSWLEQKEQRLALEEKQEVGAAAHDQDASSSGCARIPARGSAKAKARLARFEELHVEGSPDAQRDERDLHPAGPAARRSSSIEADKIGKAFGDRAAVREPVVQLAAAAASSASSARTAPARRRCSA